jgi:hypothetical protein
VNRSAAHLLVLLVGLSAGCADQTGPRGVPNDRPDFAQFSLVSLRPRTLRDEFLDLAHTTRGFGGVYYDTNHKLTINVARADFSNSDIARVMQWARSHVGDRAGSAPRLAIVPFSYDALDSLSERLIARIGTGATLRSFGVDEARDEIFIAVENPEEVNAVLAAARALQIPRSAINVTIEPTRNMQCQEDCGGGGSGGGGGSLTLWDYVRPTQAGLKIYPPGQGYCSLGFGGYTYPPPANPNVFMTAGHCNTYGNPGDMESTVFLQGPAGNQQIGVEVWQAPVYTIPNTNCPSGLPVTATRCTFADLLVGRYDDSVSAGSGNVELTATSSITITGLLGVRGNLYGAITGEAVSMVGATSGTQPGVVTHSCVNVASAQDTHFYVICAGEASFCSAGGDSGAPVWVPCDPNHPTSTPAEAGIYFAGYANCAGSYYDNFGQILNAQGSQYFW